MQTADPSSDELPSAGGGASSRRPGAIRCSAQKLRLTAFVDDVEENDATFLSHRHRLVQQDRHNVPHVIFHLLTVSIRTHCQVLCTHAYITVLWTPYLTDSQRVTLFCTLAKYSSTIVVCSILYVSAVQHFGHSRPLFTHVMLS